MAVEIDDSLYSRQRYVLGDDAMLALARGKVLIIGLGGLGVEIAKNVILSGPCKVALCDTHVTTREDIDVHFYLNANCIGRSRAQASLGPLQELNSHVVVELREWTNDIAELVAGFDCVVAADELFGYSMLKQLDNGCRAAHVKFIAAFVHGLLGWAFCDFGEQFVSSDGDGEETDEIAIASIDQELCVCTLEAKPHGLQTGDSVILKDVIGMDQLNGIPFSVTVIDSWTFRLISPPIDAQYHSGGTFRRLKKPITYSFDSFEAQTLTPRILDTDFDQGKSLSYHFALMTLLKFVDEHKRLPQRSDVTLFQSLALDSPHFASANDVVNEQLCSVASSSFPPLLSVIGGFVSQEVIKALTAKFTPLNQWFYHGCLDLYGEYVASPTANQIEICLGQQVLNDLCNLKLFMVGCGAIGCELLKNFALLCVATGESGRLNITDNDLIETSNLNRQFLFRPRHVNQPKSRIAARAALEINDRMHITDYSLKVSADTDQFDDAFFASQDAIFSALDNVVARVFLDNRCVSTERPLFDSGTLGTKGHVQVVVPRLTESYGSASDPPELQVPFCTLKSFPANTDHTIIWAKHEFDNQFNEKPAIFNKFWRENGTPNQVLEKLKAGDCPEGFSSSVALLRRPQTWSDCVKMGRARFEKLFNHKAKQLLQYFPENYRNSDGTLFWQSPKRPPVALAYELNQPNALAFVEAFASMTALTYGINVDSATSVSDIVASCSVPPFQPKQQVFSEDLEPMSNDEQNERKLLKAIEVLEAWLLSNNGSLPVHNMTSIPFEKDDSLHIDFIAAASNLRAVMYRLEPTDRYTAKRVAGHIVPAIATTTAMVAGLVAIQLVAFVKHRHQLELQHFANTFVNLSLPSLVSSEPGPALLKKVAGKLYMTIWDKILIDGNRATTLQQLIYMLKEKHNLDVELLQSSNTSKLIYSSYFPNHKLRLSKTITELCDIDKAVSRKYVDMIASLSAPDDVDSDSGESVVIRLQLDDN